jgi:hypothetical protein
MVAVMAHFKVLSYRWHGRAEENYEIACQDSRHLPSWEQECQPLNRDIRYLLKKNKIWQEIS